jgi:hypothetical protein
MGVSVALIATAMAAVETASTSTASMGSDDVVIIVDEGQETPPAEETFDVEARSTIRFDTRIAVDTSFDRKAEHVGELWLGARLELDIDLARNLSVFAAPDFDYAVALDREGGDRQFLYLLTPEAFVSFSYGPFALRAGALVFSWGPSDIMAPNDLLNPVDLRRSFLGVADEAKIPVLGIDGALTFGPLTMRAVVLPFFTASRFHLSGWDFSALNAGVFPLSADFPIDEFFSEAEIDELGDQLLATDRPPNRPDNATFAGQVRLSIGSFDLGVNASYGWDTLPFVVIDDDLVFIANRYAETRASGEPFPLTDSDVLAAVERLREAIDGGRRIAKGTYLRRPALGFDAVVALDPIILKVDVAYSFKHTVYTLGLEPKAHPWLNAVLGLEYLDGETFQVIVELFAMTIFDVPETYRLLFFEKEDAELDAGRSVVFPGVAAAVRYGILDGDLRFELGASATLRGDVVLLPSIQWKIDDMHRLVLGGMAVEGRGGSYGARYTNTDQVYVAYRWAY